MGGPHAGASRATEGGALHGAGGCLTGTAGSAGEDPRERPFRNVRSSPRRACQSVLPACQSVSAPAP
eukprot:5881748-Alexandrium_andersonii.AAC.1